MSQHEKILEQVLRGASDANVSFSGLCGLLTALEFQERINGSHHIFWRTGIEEIINLQPKDAQAKPYQVKQVRKIILKHKLGMKP